MLFVDICLLVPLPIVSSIDGYNDYSDTLFHFAKFRKRPEIDRYCRRRSNSSNALHRCILQCNRSVLPGLGGRRNCTVDQCRNNFDTNCAQHWKSQLQSDLPLDSNLLREYFRFYFDDGYRDISYHNDDLIEWFGRQLYSHWPGGFEGKLSADTKHRTCNYLNNIIEADHGALKQVLRPTRAFQTTETASVTIKGFEVMRMIRRDIASLISLTSRTT